MEKFKKAIYEWLIELDPYESGDLFFIDSILFLLFVITENIDVFYSIRYRRALT